MHAVAVAIVGNMGVSTAPELPPDVRTLAEGLLQRLSAWMGFRLDVDSCEVHLRYHNGHLEWIAPSPRIGGVRVSSDEPAVPPTSAA